MQPLPPSDSRERADDEVRRLLMIGVDHRTAPLPLRERLAYDGEEERALLRALLDRDGDGDGTIREAFLLSTCNRTELYLSIRSARDQPAAFRRALDLAFAARAPEIESEGRFFTKRGEQAVRHLLEVACGLCSMVLGEPEILGQIKQGAARAEAEDNTGPMLRRLLRHAVAAGGRARRETAIGAGAVSFGYAVVDLARSIFQRLEDCSVLVIGAGETGRLVARNLRERGAGELRVTNRGSERLERFVAELAGAVPVPWAERAAALVDTDLVVATTSAPEPVVLRADLAAAMDRRRGKPLLVADLGVPRNVERSAAGLENLFLQDIDTLETLIERNLKRRRGEIPRVHEILDHEERVFERWCRSLAAEPLVADLQRQAEAIRKRELESVRARFPEDLHDELERLTRGLVRKLLHHPSRALRAPADDRPARLDLVRRLYDLDDTDLDTDLDTDPAADRDDEAR